MRKLRELLGIYSKTSDLASDMVSVNETEKAKSGSTEENNASRMLYEADLAVLQDCVAASIEDVTQTKYVFSSIDFATYKPDDILIAGITIKERSRLRGGYVASQHIFERLINAHPNYARGYYELAVSLRYQKKIEEAYLVVCRGLEHSEMFDLLALKSLILASMGSTEKAELIARGLQPSDVRERVLAENLLGFASYLGEFPHIRAKHLISEIRRNHYWANDDECLTRIVSAITNKRPFALIRLGDGEGAYARISQDDESKYVNLYHNIRNKWKEFLMGENFDPGWTGFTGLSSSLMRFSLEADLIGLPYDEWIDHEYGIVSSDTIPCIVNILRWYASDQVSCPITLCGQDIHSRLQHSGGYNTILAHVDCLTVISCHVGLGDRLRQTYGLATVEEITVPSESDARSLGRGVAPVSAHYPGRFWDVIDELSRPLNGRLFLVAAGVFGKFYSVVIKRNGGIAIDVGSTVDVWMSIPSREGYDDVFGIDAVPAASDAY